MIIPKEDQLLIDRIKSAIGSKKYFVKRRASGLLKHDYLVPGGFYNEQWDWDGFYMGVALASEIPTEAVFLKNWALNYMELSDERGYSPGCVTPNGPEKGTRAFPMKPFIAQGVYLSSNFLNDFIWIKHYYKKLRKMVLYREKNLWSKKLDLGVWGNLMESGADNNLSILGFPKSSVVATDVNTFIYREYKAMSKIASALNKKKDVSFFAKRAETIKKNMQKYLWDDTDKTFYNYNLKTNEFIRKHTYSNMIPLWEKIASLKDGKEMIEKYVVNPNKLWSNHGIRTLTKDDPLYNNKKMITPYSNWQGPVWPHTNYMHMHSLLNYGFEKEAFLLSRKITQLCLSDFEKSGGMHECYSAETGAPLAADNFVSWNLLVGNMLPEAYSGNNPFSI